VQALRAPYFSTVSGSRLYSLRKLRKAGLKQSDLATVYCSFIRSLLEYASPSWATLSSTLSNEIESIQRRALKIIYPDLPYADALDTTGFDTLIDRRGDACKSFVQKLKGHKSTFRNPLVNILKETPYEPVHNYCLRNATLLQLSIIRNFTFTDLFLNYRLLNIIACFIVVLHLTAFNRLFKCR
jgi:hypothetical protein